jgi:hypothetical protein
LATATRRSIRASQHNTHHARGCLTSLLYHSIVVGRAGPMPFASFGDDPPLARFS